MTRVALCLFLIAIFQYGIQKSSQADNSSKQETTEESKNGKDTTIPEPIKEVEKKKKEKDVTPDEPKKGKSSTNESSEEDKKEKDDSTKSDTDKKTKSPLDQLNPTGIQFPGKILEPVMKSRAKVGNVVSRGMDGAKEAADGAYNFFRDAVTTFF